MNKTDVTWAYELADWLEDYFPYSDDDWFNKDSDEMKKAAKILRQTALMVENKDLYIEALLAENKKLREQWGYSGMSIPCSLNGKVGNAGGGGAGQKGQGAGGKMIDIGRGKGG